MERKSIYRKLNTSLVVASTLLMMVTFNENSIHASALEGQNSHINPNLSHDKNQNDDLESKNNDPTESSSESEDGAETEETNLERDVISDSLEESEVPDESETSEMQEESELSDESEATEDEVPLREISEDQIDKVDIRNATMSVFHTRNSTTTHYTTSFIDTISPIAQDLGKEYGLYPSVIIAQAALESGWGGKSPALPDDYILSLPPNYNLFGVKGDYNGQSVVVNTKEYDKTTNKYIDVKDYFRRYPSYTESIQDYVNKMRYNTTTSDPYFYSNTWIENAPTYKDATASLTGTYATDPEYGNKLNRIIENYNLTQYDEAVFNENNDPVENIVNKEEKVLDSYSVANYASLKSNISIYNEPAYKKGYQVNLNSNDLPELNIIIKEHVVTEKQTWVKIESQGRGLGWVAMGDIVLKDLEIIEHRDVAYNAAITNSAINIYNRPAWTENNKLSALSSNFLSKEIIVKEEIVTTEGTYAKVDVDGQQLGWININGLTSRYNPILDTREVAYNATILNSSINIYSRPAWTEGNQLTVKSEKLHGKEVTVKEEIKTDEATYAKIEIDGQALGWINTGGLSIKYKPILEEQQVAYNATISNPKINIYSQPAWTEGNVLTAKSADYLGEKITVKEQILTNEAAYAKVEVDGQILGWINTNGITHNYYPILETREVVYSATLAKPSINIYSRPAWTAGNTLVAKSETYLGETITVKEEIVTEEAVYARVDINGKSIGWINTNGLNLDYEEIIATRTVAYNATISNSKMGIYSRPAWTEGNEFVTSSKQYLGRNIVVKEEIVTSEATYVKVQINGNTIGWMNTGGLTPRYAKVKEKRTTSYGATIARNLSNIYSTPAWTKGNYLTGKTSDYLGERVHVKEEIVTDEAVYALVAFNGKTLGWINTNSLETTPLVYLDAGHGGSETGAVSGGVYEKDLNLSVTKKVRDLLEAKGYTVVMAREDDRYLSLSHRAKEANNLGADIFVSIHHNAFNEAAHGIETFYYNESGNTNNPKANDKNRIQDSKKMAEEVQKELIKETGAYDRGVKKANFHVVRETEMPSILVEGGFVDNAVERAKLVLDSYQQKLANAIAKGIEKFFGSWN